MGILPFISVLYICISRLILLFRLPFHFLYFYFTYPSENNYLLEKRIERITTFSCFYNQIIRSLVVGTVNPKGKLFYFLILKLIRRAWLPILGMNPFCLSAIIEIYQLSQNNCWSWKSTISVTHSSKNHNSGDKTFFFQHDHEKPKTHYN